MLSYVVPKVNSNLMEINNENTTPTSNQQPTSLSPSDNMNTNNTNSDNSSDNNNNNKKTFSTPHHYTINPAPNADEGSLEMVEFNSSSHEGSPIEYNHSTFPKIETWELIIYFFCCSIVFPFSFPPLYE